MMTGMVHSKIICCMVLAAVLILNFILMTTQRRVSVCSACPEALQDLFCLCDKVHEAGSQESGKAQLNWSCAHKAKAGILQNKTVWAYAKMPPEAWYEMYVKPWHPELAKVGMRVLSQVISASSCERNG